jgi:hypothetical protein
MHPQCPLCEHLLILFPYTVHVSPYDRPSHRVYMTFFYRAGRHVQFCEADLKTSLPSHSGYCSRDRFGWRYAYFASHQISGYVYEVPESTIGSTLPAEQIRGCLNSMRLCLVEPHWEEVNVCNTGEESRTGAGVKRMCVTMAEDKGLIVRVFQVFHYSNDESVII